MGNAHNRRKKHEAELASNAAILPILQARAEERGTGLGHVLGVWQHAKRRFGKGSLKAMCEICGMHAVAMPYGDAQAKQKWIRENPGLLGDALIDVCASGNIVEPPVGTLGLRGL